jgi:hypothetical protein
MSAAVAAATLVCSDICSTSTFYLYLSLALCCRARTIWYGIGGPRDQGVIGEVERNLERRAAVMQAACRQAADVDVQRDVPPVVSRRRRRQPDLADDPGVQMQGVFGRMPVGQV